MFPDVANGIAMLSLVLRTGSFPALSQSITLHRIQRCAWSSCLLNFSWSVSVLTSPWASSSSVLICLSPGDGPGLLTDDSSCLVVLQWGDQPRGQLTPFAHFLERPCATWSVSFLKPWSLPITSPVCSVITYLAQGSLVTPFVVSNFSPRKTVPFILTFSGQFSDPSFRHLSSLMKLSPISKPGQSPLVMLSLQL